MDIPKYIGLYLLKNNFCYVHGLGNMEMKKVSATYDSQALTGPSFQVVLSHTGSIDDNFANFIATNEQISISKASNALRDFSTQARTDLHNGKEVVIPSVGKFTEKNGVVQFITDPHLQYTPPSIPTLRSAKRLEEATVFNTYTPANIDFNEPGTTPAPTNSFNTGTINWGKIAIMVGILVVIIAAAIIGISYFTGRQSSQPSFAPPPQVIAPKDTAKPQAMSVAAMDSIAKLADTTHKSALPAMGNPPAPAAAPVANTIQYKVLLNSYDNLAKAQKRMDRLKGFHYAVQLVTKDSAHYQIVLPVSSAAADTTHVLDSLKRVLNPKGVSMYR